MLSLHDGRRGMHRRRFLTIGGLGIAGVTLPSLLAARALAQEAGPLSGRSVIFLFQQGGPSQFETFDPKMDAPDGVRSVTGEIPTTLPGITFGSTMPRLAERAHKLTLLRSFHTNNAGHNIQPIVGPDSRETNIGAHFARVAGATRPASGVPTNAVLFPSAVDPNVPKPQARGDLSSTGDYGKGFAPFVPGAGGQLQSDMQLRLAPERFGERRALLGQLDRLNRAVDRGGEVSGVDDIQRQAYEVLLGGGVSRALDLSLEDAATFDSYDTGAFAREGRWNKVSRGRSGYYSSEAKTIGHLLLMARRLCEAGCGFVTIHAGYAGVWDMHADGNNLNMLDGMEAVGRSFDHAVAAFIDDLEARGLSDRILLVATGEMGRTPKINKNGGRDHWSRLAPLLLYGGGLPGGQVIGQSDRLGGEPAGDAYGPRHLIATILQSVFDVGQLRLVSGVPQPLLELAQAEPLPLFA